jgi:hypothetical protein
MLKVLVDPVLTVEVVGEYETAELMTPGFTAPVP